MTTASLDLNTPAAKHQIRNKLEELEICQKQKLDTTEDLLECRADHKGPAFWQKPLFLVGEFTVTVSLTALAICSFHIFGACQ